MEKYINQYLNLLKTERKSSETLRTTRLEIEKFIREIGMVIDTDIISEYMEELSPQTVNKKLVLLRGFFRFLKKRGIVKENVFEGIRSPRRRRTIPKYLEEDEFLKIKNAIRSLPDSYENALISGIFGALYSGLRFAEILNLSKDAVDLKNRIVKVNGKGDKDRILNLGQFSWEMFDRWLQFRNGTGNHMFTLKDGNNISNKGLRYLISKVTKHILGKSRTPHEFRHSVATMLMRESGRLDVIKEYLGHESIDTTMIYTHLADKDMRAIINNSQALS